MRATSRLQVRVDLIAQRADVAELAKLGRFLGGEVVIGPADQSDGFGDALTVRGLDDHWLTQDAAALVALHSVAHDEELDAVLAKVREQLEKWHFPMQGKPSDNRGIGEGHVEGQ